MTFLSRATQQATKEVVRFVGVFLMERHRIDRDGPRRGMCTDDAWGVIVTHMMETESESKDLSP